MTEAELPKLLTELEQSTNKLNVESNSINTIIESVETRLRTANPGIECVLGDHKLETRNEKGVKETGNLGFGKSGESWGLFVYNLDHEDTTGFIGRSETIGASTQVPLAKTSRGLRIAALRELPRLIETLTKKVTESVKAIEDAKRLVF